jgi:hypothetical protein
MSDLKLYADVIHTVDTGFQTIKGKQLDDLYKKYNGTFQNEDAYMAVISGAIDAFLLRPELHRPMFLRAHIFQTIVLALIENKTPGSIPDLAKPENQSIAQRVAQEATPLDILGEALGDPDAHPTLIDFIKACTTRTNVESQRLLRFFYFKNAL